jgi:Holliday junction resolvase RusA-like endonuclease
MTNRHSGKKFVNSDVRRYIELNKYKIMQKMQDVTATQILAPVDLHLFIYRPDARVRDKDNILKCIFDTIKIAGIIKDDSQIKNFAVNDCGIRRGDACIIFFLLPHTPQALIEEYYNHYFENSIS